MEEVLGMADRAYVMHEGRISGELGKDNLSEESIMHLATGGEKISRLILFYEKNIIGIFSLLVVIFIITAIINPKFLNAYNMQNLIKWSSLYAVMSIGVAIVIITGGIDLSIGSVVGLVAVVLAFCLKIQGMDPWLSIGLTLGLSLLIGLVHGLLVTKAGIQPFVVTLCGLLVYRSLGRWLTDNQSLVLSL